MSGKSRNERYPQSRTDTTIGAGTRAEGNITFTGVLRIQGDVLGDVSCATDAQGTLVVGESGNVAGTITAPHIVVSGRVTGPVHSSESIEIRPGACVAGDVDYRLLDIHAGGAVEGSLIPALRSDQESPAQEHRTLAPEPAAGEFVAPSSTTNIDSRFGGRRVLGGAVVLLIAAITVVMLTRDPPPIAQPADDVAPKATSPAPQVAPLAGDGRQDDAKAVAGVAVPPAPVPTTDTSAAAQASPADSPERIPGTVVAIHGVNPGKPAGVFLVICKEPSVLFRKKRQDPGEGTRIEVAQGATESIAFARNEIFRVASGRDITIFYQGRKVTPRTIETGAWMSFVPQSAGGASDK